MGWIIGVLVVVGLTIAFLGWACCRVAGDADDRAGYPRG